MMRQFQIEWIKFSKNNVVWIMLALFAVILPSKLWIGSKMDVKLPDAMPGVEIFDTFPTVWDFLAYNGNWQIFFFFGLLIIYIVTSEFANKTARQNIIQGATRTQYFTGKLSVVAILILAATIYFTIIGLAIGISHTTDWDWSMAWGTDYIIVRFAIMVLGYCSFALLIGMLVRKTALAMLIYIAYILFLEPIIRWGIHKSFIPGNSQFYYPLNAIEDLCPLPFYNMIPEFMNGEGRPFIHILTPSESILASLIYSTLFISGAYYLFAKRDL